MNRVAVTLAALLALCAACAYDGEVSRDEPETPPVSDVGDDDFADDDTAPDNDGLADIPPWMRPCEAPRYWPLSIRSLTRPAIVHFRTPDEEPVARDALRFLEDAWALEIDELGFTEPPPDGGACGPDDAFDVFLWKGNIVCYVDIAAESIVTAWGGRPSFMLLDPWGPYGGDLLASLVGHEFHHASQAADDWHEIGVSFEMSATYVEEMFDYPCAECVADFQAHPDWSVLRYDNYRTWFMYGAALYLHGLRDAYFGGEDDFLAEIWRRSRNDPDPFSNEPDFVDAIDALLQERAGADFLDSVVTFARWRWYAGSRDDGAHFRAWTDDKNQIPFLPEADLAPTHRVRTNTAQLRIRPAPMMLGSAYIEIRRGVLDPAAVSLAVDGPDDESARVVAQIIPGDGTDGDVLNLETHPVIDLAVGQSKILVLTILPAGAFDADALTDRRYNFTLRMTPEEAAP